MIYVDVNLKEDEGKVKFVLKLSACFWLSKRQNHISQIAQIFMAFSWKLNFILDYKLKNVM